VLARIGAGVLALALFLFLLLAPIYADEPQVYVEWLPLAHHYGGEGNYAFNAALKGDALLVPLDESDKIEVLALHYTNSFYRTTNVIGLSWMPLRIGAVSFGGVAGISNKDAYPYSPIKPVIAGGEVNVALGSRARLNFVVMPCGGGAWCSVAVAAGIAFGVGQR